MTESGGLKTTSVNDGAGRIYDLDALRAFAMFLGIVLHVALAYFEVPIWPIQDSNRWEGFGDIVSAIHGFRMPVFFLLSGFFTAMLWRKRGLSLLVKHRLNRIGIPLLLSLVTVIPAMTCVSVFAGIANGINTTNDGGIIEEARKGDIDSLKKRLENGVGSVELDNIRDKEFGMTLLSWVAIHGYIDAASILMDSGVGINSKNRDGGTALHTAAFLGRSELVELLIKNGAEVNSLNNDSLTPLDVAYADIETTKYITDILSIECCESDAEIKKLRNDRAQTIDILKRNKAVHSPKDAKKSDESGEQSVPSNFMRSYLGIVYSDFAAFLIFASVFHHLWFLWYLLWLAAGFVLFVKVTRLLRLSVRLPHWTILSPVNLVFLVALTSIPQIAMGVGGSNPSFGPDTAPGIIPLPHLLLYYAIFFGFGALYFDAKDETGRLGRLWWIYLPISIFLIFPIASAITYEVKDQGAIQNLIDSNYYRPLSVIFQSLYPWLMSFGLIGAFRKLLSRENYAIRYLSDASYWLYLVHLPAIILFQIPMMFVDVPAVIKFVFVSVLVVGLFLVVYKYLVRYTWLGTTLNGKRERPLVE